jgi:hypothetical protein
MKILRNSIGVLIVFMLSQINMFAQSKIQDINKYPVNAINQAVIQYHQQKHVGYYKYMVIRMKIMRIDKISGEFVLNYICNDVDYEILAPTHYIHVNNELILIILDSKCKTDIVQLGISKITEAIKNEALKILAGPDLFISGQEPPDMIFKYRKNKLKSIFYLSYPPPKKYWF